MYYTFEVSAQTIQQFIAVNLDDGGVCTFPVDEKNPEYQKYLEWVAEGNIPEPWNPEQENN